MLTQTRTPAPAMGNGAAPVRDVAVTIPLSRPVPGHNGDVTHIELRHPVFGDWIECGDLHETTVIDPAGMQRGEPGAARVAVKPEAVAAWFARLSNLPMATIYKLELGDGRRVFREISALVGSLDAGN